MQFSDTCVATKDLTKSFGWDSVDALMQHDIQELNRMLTDKLDEKMKVRRNTSSAAPALQPGLRLPDARQTSWMRR